MQEIEDKISLFVKDQFPSFYEEEGEVFQAFLHAYYEFLETSGQSVQVARNQLEYRDVDKTSSLFLEEFKKTYLRDLPGLINADDRLTIKNIFDFYKSKGSQRSIQLLFRILFNESAVVEYPSKDVIKPSDAKFILPRYIECYAPSLDNLKTLEGVEIVGASSGAKAFVESISTKLLNNVRTNVLRLSNLRGNFLRGEVLARSTDGIQDDMPVVTGSLSSVNITLGGSNNAVGDIFNITSAQGKQGQARVTAIADATGLVSFNLANGGFGFSTNTDFTEIKVNDQNLQVSNVVNEAQTYNNSDITAYDYVGKKIDDAVFTRFETVDQTLETVTLLSASDFNTEFQEYELANPDGGAWVIGTKGANSTNVGTVIANGFVTNSTIDGANGTFTISPITGSFGFQNDLGLTFADATHTFQVGERVDEESSVELTFTSNTAAFSAGDIVRGDESLANGTVASVNSTVLVLNKSYGTWVANDNVFIETSNTTTANVTDINITTLGANAEVSSVNATHISISDINGEFNTTKQIKGQRTQALAIIDSVTDSGPSDVFFNANLDTQAVIDTYANVSVSGVVIGQNATNVGFKSTVYSNGTANASFVANTYAPIIGRDSNTYANVVTVGTGTGAGFKVGTLENEDAITIYTDVIGENNSSNVSYLDCIIDGGNSGIGFLDSITITANGTGYTNGQTIVFDRGGAGGGPPNINAVATITTDDDGDVSVLTVTNPGDGFYTESAANLDNLSTGSSLAFTANFDFGYGFPKDGDGDFTTILDNVLTRFSGNIGTISSLSEINPGNNYNFDPFLNVYTSGIAKFDKRDLKLNITDRTGTFVLGENITQTVSNQGQSLTLSNFAGAYSNGDSYTPTIADFLVGTSVEQVINSTANAVGDIFTKDASSISIINPRIKELNTTSNTFSIDSSNLEPFIVDSSNLVFSTSPNTALNIATVSAEITGTGTVSQSAVAKGTVYGTTEDPDAVFLRRLSFQVGFGDGDIQGGLSGATATIVGVEQDANSRPIGDNANVTAIAQAANGIVTSVEVIDSGFGYQHDSDVTLVSTNTAQNIVVSGTANVTLTGKGPGFWEDKTSFLNNKYIHDNDFYQSYSYLVETGLSLDKYRDILLEVSHIAGTKLFGRVVKESTVNNAITVSNSSIGIL